MGFRIRDLYGIMKHFADKGKHKVRRHSDTNTDNADSL